METRREYTLGKLNSEDLNLSPVDQFASWLKYAGEKGISDTTAMSLATADKDGMPTVRTVLLKSFDSLGFVWYSDERSEKGRSISDRPVAEILFFWKELERQVRIRGNVEMVGEEEVQDYFFSRPRESQIAASISQQSQPIETRLELERRYEEFERKHNSDLVLPEHWRGYCLLPSRYEFWQGRKGRLHDRFEYVKSEEVSVEWVITRLQP